MLSETDSNKGKKYLCNVILAESWLNLKLSNLTENHTPLRFAQIPSIDSRSAIKPKQTTNWTEVTKFCFGQLKSKLIRTWEFPTMHTNLKQLWLRQVRPHFADSLSSMVRPSVHTNQSPKRSFSKTLFKLEKFASRLDWKQFENGAFGERWRHDNYASSLPQFSSNTKI